MPLIPIRQDIEIILGDKRTDINDQIIISSRNNIYVSEPSRSMGSLGWTVSETIGIGIVNPRAINKLNKNTKVGI
jgi:hypothetical protein